MAAKKMKAAVLREFGEPLTIEEKAVSESGPGEVLVKVKASGLCVSGLHIQDGLIRTVRLSHTPGHEMAGEITAVGPGVTRVKIGNHITATIGLVCRSCRYCLGRRANLCRSLERTGFEQDGSHQECYVMLEENAFSIVDWIPSDQITGLSDAVDCMHNAIKNRAQIGPGSRLLILGTGGLGMDVIQLVRVFGMEAYAIGCQKAKLDTVSEMGAGGVISTSHQDLEQEVDRLTGGETCSAVIDNIDIKDSTNQALKVTASEGRVIVRDYQYPYFIADYRDVMKFEKEVVGLRGMTRQDLEEVIRLVESRRIAPSVYQTIPFEVTNEDPRMLRTGAAKGRTVLKMEE